MSSLSVQSIAYLRSPGNPAQKDWQATRRCNRARVSVDSHAMNHCILLIFIGRGVCKPNIYTFLFLVIKRNQRLHIILKS